MPAESLRRTGVVEAVFTTRLGGVSRGRFASLNLVYGGGDEPDAVTANRRRLCGRLGIEPGRLAEAEQVHGTGVAVLEPETASAPPRAAHAGPAQRSDQPSIGRVPGVDGLLTTRRNLWLVIYTADCVPVLIVDPKTPAVAAVHAGWRGTARGIAPAAIARMRAALGSDPAACLVELGPAIGGCCYEVDLPVARAMEGAPWWSVAASPTGRDRWHLDLRTAVRHQLVEAGVPAGQITTAPYCTACRPDLFFSYRRDGITGRMAACIALRGAGG